MGRVTAASPRTLRTRVAAALVAVTLLAIVLRLVALVFEPPLHPDEYFQYLEPAWWHLTGVGLAAWEWFDGLRSWVLPFYNGAWMALLMRLGVRHGATLGLALQAHWAVLNAGIAYLAWRAGSSLSRKLLHAPTPQSADAPPAGWQGGLLAAALCGAFPMLVRYAGHTLSELPSMLFLIAGLTMLAELTEHDEHSRATRTRKAALAGTLLSLGACLRIASGPLVLIAPLWLIATRRAREVIPLLVGALPPALAFALVDLLTWGSFAGSFVAYVDFNLIRGGAADFGTEPPGWYLETIWQRAPLGLPLLLVPALWGLRATWPFVLSAAFLIAFLSTQPHKEERFIIAFWPLVLIAAGGALGAFIARSKELRANPDVAEPGAPSLALAHSRGVRLKRNFATLVSSLLVVLVLLDGVRHYRDRDPWLSQDRLRCQAWAGAQPDVTGLLVDRPFWTGATLWFGSRAPMLEYAPALLANPLFTHVLARARSKARRRARAAGFAIAHREGEFVVMRRKQPPQP